MSDIVRLFLFESGPEPETYRGFNLKNESKRVDEAGLINLTLTNGVDEITVNGYNEDQALVRAFNMIDRYYRE